MSFKVLGAVALLVWSAAFSGAPASAFENRGQAELPLSRLVIESANGAHEFTVEFAATPRQRQLGLMFRREMATDRGMLFEFRPPQLVSMWMKNTYLPLDILFIDADGRIINIARDTTPFSLATISSAGPALAALELNAGVAEKLGLKSGDRVTHRLFAAPR